ncbi:MAG: hypothetical protein ACMUIU_10510 [bacterium]
MSNFKSDTNLNRMGLILQRKPLPKLFGFMSKSRSTLEQGGSKSIQ